MKKLILFLFLPVLLMAQRPAVYGPGVTQGSDATFSSITDTSLTAGRVVYTGTGGLLSVSVNLLFDGTSLSALAYVSPPQTTTYAATTDIVMTKTLQTVSLTGDVTFTTSAKAAGQFVTVRIICDGTARAFTFPGTWVWVGSVPPAQIVASKVGILSLICFGTTDADVVASWVTSL